MRIYVLLVTDFILQTSRSAPKSTALKQRRYVVLELFVFLGFWYRVLLGCYGSKKEQTWKKFPSLLFALFSSFYKVIFKYLSESFRRYKHSNSVCLFGAAVFLQKCSFPNYCFCTMIRSRMNSQKDCIIGIFAYCVGCHKAQNVISFYMCSDVSFVPR